MKNTMKAIAALIISATMISITACGNTDNTLSAAPKATTTAARKKATQPRNNYNKIAEANSVHTLLHTKKCEF